MAGVPPDYFSATGQLWGNPVYNWREMEKDGYAWWKSRIRRMLDLYDYVRIDHFRGFAGFWEVPAGETTAEKGRWMKGPGKRFFESLRAEFGDLPFIAEDLGYITPDVRNLKNILGFPGMKIFQFEEWPLQWPTYLEREIDPGHGGAEPDGEPRTNLTAKSGLLLRYSRQRYPHRLVLRDVRVGRNGRKGPYSTGEENTGPPHIAANLPEQSKVGDYPLSGPLGSWKRSTYEHPRNLRRELGVADESRGPGTGDL